MQESFGFEDARIAWWRQHLSARFAPAANLPRRRPLGQLIKSLISSRTRDAVSQAAYNRLVHRWPSPVALAEASPAEIEKAIFDVTFADKKAAYLPAALEMIGRERPDFGLEFLGGLPVEAALSWLERLPGVGRKVAAATLNASTLRRPVFIVDSHVQRTVQRLGFISDGASAKAASEAVTAGAPGLGADGLFELFVHLKRLGQTVCRFDAPQCSACPLAPCCRTARKDN